MIWWIVLGIVLFSLVVLGLAVRPVLVRLPRLVRAASGAQQRAVDAQALQVSAVSLQERVAEVQESAAQVQRRLDLIKEARAER
jgi:NhaP-type Na+/H+ or K+/H+ antiporter